MKNIAKRLLDFDLSRREFARALLALGFSGTAARGLAAEFSGAADGPGRQFSGTGAEVLAETLLAADIEYIFSTTATGMSPFFDALSQRPQLKYILSIAESQATSMAHGYELASGKPGTLLVPGVAIPSAMNNLYNAWKDRSSLLVLSDGPSTAFRGRNTFQQMDDWLDPLTEFTKWRWEVMDAGQLAEMVRRALKLTKTPPGGPVHVRLPLDVLGEPEVTETIYPQSRFDVAAHLSPRPDLIEQAADILIAAGSPLINVGAEVTRAGATGELLALAESIGARVSQGFSVYGDVPFKHSAFAGFFGPGVPQGAPRMDVFLNLGAPMPSPGFFTMPIPGRARIIDARSEYDDIGNTYPTEVAIAGDMGQTIAALGEAVADRLTENARRAAQQRNAELSAAAQKDWDNRRQRARQHWNASPMSWPRVSFELDQALADDAVIVSELDYRTPYFWLDFAPGKKRLIGPSSGYALGWGIGAALGAKVALPDSQIVALVGDGAMLFGQLEALWSAARYEIPITIVVFNNRSYDGERDRIFDRSPLAQNPDTRHLWKDMSCYLGNPLVDFTAIARAFDIPGQRAESPEQLQAALRQAQARNRDGQPYLIDANIMQLGAGADVNWHPDISIARTRGRKI